MELAWQRRGSYHDRFVDALELLDCGDFKAAIAVAKDNLSNLSLPRFYQIENCIIVLQAEEDWDEAERYRVVAEELWVRMRSQIPSADEEGQKTLRYFRANLDKVKEVFDEERPRDIGASRGLEGAEPASTESGIEVGEEDEGELDEETYKSDDEDEYAESIDIITIIRQSMDSAVSLIRGEKLVCEPLKRVVDDSTDGSPVEPTSLEDHKESMTQEISEAPKVIPWAKFEGALAAWLGYVKTWAGIATDLVRRR